MFTRVNNQNESIAEKENIIVELRNQIQDLLKY